jgi:serine protease Do
MNTRTRTIASFFSVAMAAMLLGALVTSQIQRPEAALARPAEVSATLARLPEAGQGAPFGVDTFRDIAREVTPGVVNINTSKTVRRQGGADPFREFFGDDFMERFFGPQGRRGRQTFQSLGSGFIIDTEGYVLTNRHVIDEADEIRVTLASGKTYDAKLVGKDARTDVALLKIEAKEPLTLVPLGDSDRSEVGDWVMAIGNPFGLGGNSVTVGVVSFKGRNLTLGQPGTGVEMVQTDAAINPGNSGGPLLNTRGEVIGINTLIITQGIQQSAGVGFAVPINVAKAILPQLREKGKVVRGWLGVQITPLDDVAASSYGLKEAKGAIVNDVTAGSPAEKAGVKVEDVILGVDGRDVNDNADLSNYIASKAPGTTVRLRVHRDGSERAISVTLGTFPDETPQSASAGETEGRPSHGMTLRNLTPEMADHLEMPEGARGVVVTDVEPGEPAERAGLRQGDVIVSVNSDPVADIAAFSRAVEKAKASGVARLRIWRGNGYQLRFLKLD